MAVALPAWSIAICVIWGATGLQALALTGLACYLGGGGSISCAPRPPTAGLPLSTTFAQGSPFIVHLAYYPAMQLSTYEFTAISAGLICDFDFIAVHPGVRKSVDAFAPFMGGAFMVEVRERVVQ